MRGNANPQKSHFIQTINVNRMTKLASLTKEVTAAALFSPRRTGGVR